jgi:hypothetical protein
MPDVDVRVLNFEPVIYSRQGNLMTHDEYAAYIRACAEAGEDPIGVARTELDGVTVSTVWLAIDYSMGLLPCPVIFETAIFGGPLSESCWRWSTEQEALAGHAAAVEIARMTLIAGWEPWMSQGDAYTWTGGEKTPAP